MNTQLLDQIAESTRAFSQYVLANEDLEVKVSNFYTRIKEPALTNLRLEFSPGVQTTKMYPSSLPDLFKGDQLVVAGRYQGSGEVEAKLTGTAGGREQTFTYKIHFDDRNMVNPQFIKPRRDLVQERGRANGPRIVCDQRSQICPRHPTFSARAARWECSE